MDIASLTSASGQNFNEPDALTRSTGKQVLDANDFLRLLTVQLQSQDPMKPMEDMAFISQMASFTSLEQMRGLSADFKDFTASQRFATAQTYLGKLVTVAGAEGEVTGEVTAVEIEDGTPWLTIGTKTYDASTVTSVRPKAATAADPAPPTVGTGPTAAPTQTPTQTQ